MGGVAVTDRRTAPIVVTAPRLRRRQSLYLVRGVVDLAGPGRARPRVSRHKLDVTGNQATFTVRTRTSCYVRVEARTGRGKLVAFSNPIWLLKDVPPGGIPSSRLHELG